MSNLPHVRITMLTHIKGGVYNQCMNGLTIRNYN